MDLLELIKKWCDENNINYREILPDTGNTTLMVNVGDPKVIRKALKGKNVDETKQVIIKKSRNGTRCNVIDLSINDSIERNKMDYKDKLEDILFSEKQTNRRISPTKFNKKRSRRGQNGAGKGLSEEQYKGFQTPTKSMKTKSKLAPTEKARKSKSDSVEKPNAIVSMIVASGNDDGFIKKATTFRLKLAEALEGMATPHELQPTDLINSFYAALHAAGTELNKSQGVSGSIKELLDQRNIHIGQSKDGQALIVYVNTVLNGNKHAQEMMSIPIDDLAAPDKMQKYIVNLIEYAKGVAPGDTERKMNTMREQEKLIRQAVDQYAPKNDVDTQSSEVGTQLARNV